MIIRHVKTDYRGVYPCSDFSNDSSLRTWRLVLKRKYEPQRHEGHEGFIFLPDRGPVFALRASPRQVPIRETIMPLRAIYISLSPIHIPDSSDNLSRNHALRKSLRIEPGHRFINRIKSLHRVWNLFNRSKCLIRF